MASRWTAARRAEKARKAAIASIASNASSETSAPRATKVWGETLASSAAIAPMPTLASIASSATRAPRATSATKAWGATLASSAPIAPIATLASIASVAWVAALAGMAAVSCGPAFEEGGAGGGGATGAGQGPGGSAPDAGEGCTPGTKEACYSGPASTADVGACESGQRVCAPDGTWGACEGEVVPAAEDCSTPIDEDCDGAAEDDADDGCACVPGETFACYSGPAGTEGVGACQGGTATCEADGKGLGACAGEVVPAPEDCSNLTDDDCDGVACAAPIWARIAGDATTQVPADVAPTPDGGVVVIGTFSGTLAFDPREPLVAASTADVFVVKLDAAGEPVWSRRFGESGVQAGRSVAVGPDGGVVLAGNFVGSISFGGASLASAGAADVFVAKLDAAGAHVWSQRFGSEAAEGPVGVAVGADGAVIVAGNLPGSMDFDQKLESAGSTDVFVAKLDGATGAPIWSRRFGDALAQTTAGVAVDSVGGIVLAGTFAGLLDFQPVPLLSQTQGDVWVAKLNAGGEGVWAHRYGGAQAQAVRGVAVGPLGEVVVTGELSGTVDFGGGPVTSGADPDVFVVRYSSGGAHVATAVLGGEGQKTAGAVAVDSAGRALVTGRFAGTLDLGGVEVASQGQNDAFVAKLGAAGALVWGKAYGDGDDQAGTAIAAGASDALLFAGACHGTTDLDGIALPSAGDADAVVAKIAP